MAEEARLVARIKDLVASVGGKTVKIHQSGFSEIGMPDLIVFLPNGTYMVEVKAQGKKPEPIQLAKIAEINSAGGKAFWCDTIDGFSANTGIYMLHCGDKGHSCTNCVKL